MLSKERSGSLFCRTPTGIPQKDTGEYKGDTPELLQRYNNQTVLTYLNSASYFSNSSY